MYVYIITMFISMMVAFLGQKYQIFIKEKNNIENKKYKIKLKRINRNNVSISKTRILYYIYLILSSIPFIIISSIRYYVGTDYETYIKKQIPDIIDEVGDYVEPGYRYIVKITNHIFNDYQWVFIITSIIIILLIFGYMFRESESICLSIYVFVMSSVFNQSLNIMRQFIAISIFLYAIKYIINNDWFKYFILILIASCFHKTAILFLIIYFYKYIKINRKIVIIFIFISGIFADNIREIFLMLSLKLGFYSQYFDISSAKSEISYPLLLLNIIVYITAAYLVENKNEDKHMNLYFVIEIFTLISIVLSPIIPLSYRIIFMFMSTHCIYIPLLIKRFKWKKYRWILITFYVILYGVFFVYYIGIRNYAETLPYRTIFNKSF